MTVTRGTHKGSRLPWCKPLRWRIPPGPNTALVSFPGSGNTWLRYLLQQATGYYTGSVYKDYALLKNGFPAESVANGTVLVVKTHEWGPETRKIFSKAILLIREPVQSILAEFNRQSGGHIGHAPSDKYKRDKGKYWEKFTRTKAIVWMNTTLDWLQFEGSIHLVFYEDLISNLSDEMRRIINFLGVTVSDSDFSCMMKNKDGIYKRRKRKLPFEPFNKSLRLWIDKCREIVNKTIKEYLAGNDVAEFISRTNITFPLPKETKPNDIR
ncbi:WSCD family member [Armadillidium nasatum]|uniref:WSCD family member n=1 Tax=Armadillidium nasatum TaxID=96803 RepID=A0A5N5SUA7_9CRUS|nr:WSCD family member [Armadillidium nasatum]